MKSSIYYVLLVVISTLFFIYALWRKKDNKLVALYLFVAGVTYLLEYITLVLFNGYVYYPGILKNRYFDNILGAVVSDGFTIPMIAAFVAAFRYNIFKIILVAMAMTGVDVLFVKVKIYEHHWWRYSYTFAGAVIVYYLCQKWLSVLRGRISNGIRFITLFFGNIVIQSTAVFILAGILNLYFYKVNWFGNPSRGHVAFATLHIIMITIIFVSIITFRLNWFWTALGILLPSVFDIILIRMNVLHMSDKWSLLSSLVLRIIIFSCIALFNKYLLTETEN